MNRTHAAQASASSQPMRQMLFLTLAMLVTLVVVQQYAHWMAPAEQQLLPAHGRIVDPSTLNPASAQWSGAHQAQNIERVQASEPAAPQQRWVF